jgi:hypothetical protein
MATQWLIAKRKLEDTGKDLALSLIGIMMFFHNVNIPESAFQGPSDEIPDRLTVLKQLAKRDQFFEASESLLRLSLIIKDSEDFTIHPLMHTIIFENMTPDEKQDSYENAALLLYRKFPGMAARKDGQISTCKNSTGSGRHDQASFETPSPASS